MTQDSGLKTKDSIVRCTWATSDPLYIKYHDEEWGKPVYDDKILFEFLILEGAQAGLSWITILRRRENYRKAFANFEVNKVAAFTEKDVERLMNDEGIIRNRLKVNGAITNAKLFIGIQKEFGSFSKYMWSFGQGDKPIQNHIEKMSDVPPRTELSDQISKDMKNVGSNFWHHHLLCAYAGNWHGERPLVKLLRQIMFASATIHTDRFLLRQFCSEDLAFVFEGLSHPDVIRYYGVCYASLEETNEQLIWFNELQKNETGIWWAICDQESLVCLGAIGLNDLSKTDQKAEIGFWLLPEHWGKGIIKEVANPICNYAFEKLGLRKIEAMVETENENSRKVLQKLDFDYYKTMENCEIKNDKLISLAIYVKLKHEDII